MNFGLISVFLSLILQAQTERIALTERLRWTWGSLSKSLLRPGHLRSTLVICCVVGAVYALGSGLNEGIASLLLGYKLSAVLPFALLSGLTIGLNGGLSAGLIYWLLLGLFQGIASEQIEDRARQVPNQGMQRCWHNGLLMALISAGIFAVIGTLGFGLSQVPARVLLDTLHTPNRLDILSLTVGFALSAPWLMGVCGGLLAWSMSGGLAIWRHYLIRLLLARSHAFPWRAPQFLENATARILLRRVGGGYSFPHRLLLEYFADLPQQTP